MATVLIEAGRALGCGFLSSQFDVYSEGRNHQDRGCQRSTRNYWDDEVYSYLKSAESKFTVDEVVCTVIADRWRWGREFGAVYEYLQLGCVESFLNDD